MKKSIVILTICLLIILISLFGCDNRTKVSAGIQYKSTILPLAVGNYWVYTDTTFVNDTPDSVLTKKMGITGATQIGYQAQSLWVYHWTWYDMPEDKPQTRKSLVRNEEEGLIYYGQKMGSSYTPFNRRLFVKYPVEVDDEWSYIEGSIVRSLSVSTTFETPAGIFDAHKYRITTGDRTQFIYYVPEVGYVGMEEYENGEVILSRRLTDYNVKVDHQ